MTSISPSEMLVELMCEDCMQGEGVWKGFGGHLWAREGDVPWSTYIQGKGVRSEGQNGDSHHLLSLRDALEVETRGFGVVGPFLGPSEAGSSWICTKRIQTNPADMRGQSRLE